MSISKWYLPKLRYMLKFQPNSRRQALAVTYNPLPIAIILKLSNIYDKNYATFEPLVERFPAIVIAKYCDSPVGPATYAYFRTLVTNMTFGQQ